VLCYQSFRPLFLTLKNIAKVLKLKITIKLAAQQTFLIGMLV